MEKSIKSYDFPFFSHGWDSIPDTLDDFGMAVPSLPTVVQASLHTLLVLKAYVSTAKYGQHTHAGIFVIQRVDHLCVPTETTPAM